MSESGLRARLQSFPGRGICQKLALLFCFTFLLARAPGEVPADSDHVRQSIELMGVGDLEGAEKEAKLALRDSSTRPMAWATLGAIRIRQKHYAEASDCLNTALRLNPGLVGARVSLGEVYALTGRRTEAREVFRSILRTSPDNREVRFDLARLESVSGNFAVSLTTAEP